MKQNKLIIAVLILITLLFLLGLSSGFFRDKDENDNDLSMRKAVELKNSWIGSISEKIDSFRRSLDMDRIKKRPECQVNDGVYKLTGKQDCCRIIITEKAGADVEYAVLSAKEKNIKLLVLYPDNETCPQTARGSKISLDKLKHSEVITDIGRIRPGLGQPVVSQQKLTLSVVYVPEGGNKQKAECGAKVDLCEATEEVKLTVLGKGGVLRLKCENCGDDQSVTAILK
jgi:hypothetical protein